MHLEERGFGVISAATGAEGFKLAEESSPSAIILDMRLPDASGIDLIPELKKRAAETPVLMITAHHDMATTILAMKAGAFDYIHKPIDIQALDVAIDRALEVRRLSRGTDFLDVAAARAVNIDDIVGTSPAMQQLFKDVGRVAASRATVLIQGESGTGKELIARVIHSYSAGTKPFIAINCSAIVETLLESELFGHEKGSFTGATAAKAGKFELAEDGSIFLDEIGELSQNLQAKLLRVLQERELERVGGVKRIPVRARILAATNRELAREVEAGRFREDLYQRLKVVTLAIPPLRERREDIPVLVDHFIRKHAQRAGKRVDGIEEEALSALAAYDWPGNVRELENTIERAVVLSTTPMIRPATVVMLGAAGTPPAGLPGLNLRQNLDWTEREAVRRALDSAGGVKKDAAETMGISQRALSYYLAKYRID